MATNPCGCPGNGNPDAPLTPPEGTSHAYGSIGCPKPPKPCYTAFCNDSFQSLPVAQRIEIIGVSGKCLYRIDSSNPGILAVDERGGFVVSNAPTIDLQQLVNYAQGPNGLVLDNEKNPVEGAPPEFPYLIVQLEGGEWRKVRGRPGSIGLVVWDDDGFHIKDVDDSNILISRPSGGAEQLEIVGFDTDDCLEEGERNNLVRLISDIDGVVFINSVTGKATVTSLCELFDDVGNLTGVPFLLACSDGSAIRFKGTSNSVLTYNQGTGGFELVAVDDKACDPTCGCSTELTMIYDCATQTFSITEPETHILSWRTNSDAGANVSIDFTLPWPALVTVYAGRRITPTNGALDVTRADIIIDGVPATSPSDGGLVARLDNPTTNTGVAVQPLKKGGHNAYIGNTVTTNDTIPTWAGAWIKVVAHKIKDCNPVRMPVGSGTIRAAYGGSGEECDCPPGPSGADGATGPVGPAGPAGPGGGSCTPGTVTTVGNVFSMANSPTPGTLSIYYKEQEIGQELDEETEECSWFQETIEEDRLIGQAQTPISPFTMTFIDNISFSGPPGSVQANLTYKQLIFDGQSFMTADGDVGTVSVPCTCSD